MRQEGDEWVYRPDASFDAEIDRMRAFRAMHPAETAGAAGAHHYRLNPEAFLLKFCHIEYFEPDFEGLAKGMYLPLDYVDALATAGELRGKRGGRVFGYKAIPRYLDNDLFVRLVQRGWVGSRGTTTGTLVDLIAKLVQEGRSVLYAVSAKRGMHQRSP
jgi:hypothetical protein